MARTPLNTQGQDFIVLPLDRIRGEDGGTMGTGGLLKLESGPGGTVSGGSGNVVIGPGAVVSGIIGEIQLVGLKTRTNRVQHDLGTALGAGDFALSANWGTTASVSSISGTDSRFAITILPTGTGQGTNPTITLTYKDGAWPNAPFPQISDDGSVDGTGGYFSPAFELTSRTTTTAVWTLRNSITAGASAYTPGAADTFKMIVQVFG